jgi:hypothetical protein
LLVAFDGITALITTFLLRLVKGRGLVLDLKQVPSSAGRHGHP